MPVKTETDPTVNSGNPSKEEQSTVKRLDLSLSVWDAEAILKAAETILEEVLGLKRRLEAMRDGPSKERN
jgi:hypothetical protein